MTNKLRADLQAAIDARLNDALESANFRVTLANQKQNARLKLQRDLTYSINGGIFNVTEQLISFTSTLRSAGKVQVILLDENKNPISIDDLASFNDTIIGKYYECMNEFLVEFKSIQKSRTTKAAVGE